MRKLCFVLCVLAACVGVVVFQEGTRPQLAAEQSAAQPQAALAAGAEVVRVEAVQVAGDAQSAESAQEVYLTVWDEGRTQRVKLEDFLVGVVAGEMPASYHPEALCAQAVAARSYAAWKMPAYGGGGCSKGVDTDVCTDSTHCMAYWSEEKMREQWGADYETYHQKIVQAVQDTAGQVMLYNGSPVQALFHSASGGRTEDAQAVWGTACPYLTSVDSGGEEESGQYSAVKRMTAQELAQTLNKAFEGAGLTQESVRTQFTVRSRTESGRADVVKVGAVTATGKAVRTALDLNSTNFEIDFEGDEAVLTTLGYGHGVGMSQVGANAMAQEGSGYEEILKHYYTGVEIGSLS